MEERWSNGMKSIRTRKGPFPIGLLVDTVEPAGELRKEGHDLEHKW